MKPVALHPWLIPAFSSSATGDLLRQQQIPFHELKTMSYLGAGGSMPSFSIAHVLAEDSNPLSSVRGKNTIRKIMRRFRILKRHVARLAHFARSFVESATRGCRSAAMASRSHLAAYEHGMVVAPACGIK
jgi:hypothetical protein